MKKLILALLMLPSLCFAANPWEVCQSGLYSQLYRIRVPQGWLVLHEEQHRENNLVYVPDETHEWRC